MITKATVVEIPVIVYYEWDEITQSIHHFSIVVKVTNDEKVKTFEDLIPEKEIEHIKKEIKIRHTCE